jgi:hypothetical protein
MHSTVTKLFMCRLLSINQLKNNTMRTLNNNQLTGTFENSKSQSWNSKRRFR